MFFLEFSKFSAKANNYGARTSLILSNLVELAQVQNFRENTSNIILTLVGKVQGKKSPQGEGRDNGEKVHAACRLSWGSNPGPTAY